ncbi:MAG: hypothetical protein NTX24_03270 [Candidatus Pacearchaeota archaeon]|nr:hypothetical protein [Candidatus Pacearchaeota archaeon]
MTKITLKIWILIIALLIAIIGIPFIVPGIINFKAFSGGIEIKDIEINSSAFLAGMVRGEVIKQVNGDKINSVVNYYDTLSKMIINPVDISITTNNGTINYKSTLIDFDVDNRTVSFVGNNSGKAGLEVGMIIQGINNYSLDNYTFEEIIINVEPRARIEIVTDQKTYDFLTKEDVGLTVAAMSKTNIKTGLDIQGGARALVKPERRLDATEFADLKSLVEQRLNAYGIKDVVVRSASNPFTQEQYLVIEIAGATPKELQELVGQQGKFEAKISNNTVFVGGKGDITYVCRGDATCEIIQDCTAVQGTYSCRFSFEIDLSSKAAKRQADLTAGLSENISQGQHYLNETLDLYLDDKLVDTLYIDVDLKGKETTKITISGSGTGNTKADAIKNTQSNMNKLQTILITGSLPIKLDIEKLDTISPTVGKGFSKNIFIVVIVSFALVGLLVYIRFRRPKVVIPVMITLVSELILLLGVAAIIKWNLDLPGIAGIIAAIGTGVDDQIVMIDESTSSKGYSIKERIKRAFFIIFSAYVVVIASLIPLWFAGAGMLRGFALTTAIGITVGVFITRPAFADILKKITKD